jgi:alpha-L-fucosidase
MILHLVGAATTGPKRHMRGELAAEGSPISKISVREKNPLRLHLQLKRPNLSGVYSPRVGARSMPPPFPCGSTLMFHSPEFKFVPKKGCRRVRWFAAAILTFLSLNIASGLPAQDQRRGELLKIVDRVAAQGPFRPDWNSLEGYRVPEWYQDAKFGIFIHWGVYSVPAFDNEWYPRNMYLVDSPVFKHHVATYGPQSKFGYKDFIPMFRAEKFNADRWAELFRKAGAKYVVPVAEHHDGFPMYDCSLTDWSAAKMGPKRDVVGELAAAVRRQGLHFGASSHRAEHWWFFDGGMTFDSDVKDPRYASLYGPAQPRRLPGADQDNQPDQAYLDDWLARTAEIVEKYQPEIVWFDWWIEQPVFQPYLQRFAAYYYNRGAEWKRGVAINYKLKTFPERAAVLDIERGQLDTLRPLFWQSDTSVSEKSWGYIQNDTFRTPDSLIDQLVDIVSKNGCLLLNVGPRPDGTIPEQAQEVLLEMGRWLNANGEAIYGTRPWKIPGEGPTQVVGGSFKDTATRPFSSEDIRFTTRGKTLYAIALAWPENGKLTIKSLATDSGLYAGQIGKVELLGSKARLKWTQTAEGLVIELPPERRSAQAVAVRISPLR